MICCCAVLFPIVLFLQSCLDQSNLCEGDAQNMQLKLKLLSIVVKYMMHRPNFSTVFCEAVKNTHTGESILGDLSKTLHLSLLEQIRFGLALADSDDTNQSQEGGYSCVCLLWTSHYSFLEIGVCEIHIWLVFFFIHSIKFFPFMRMERLTTGISVFR